MRHCTSCAAAAPRDPAKILDSIRLTRRPHSNKDRGDAQSHDVIPQEQRRELFRDVRQDVRELVHAHLAHEPEELQANHSRSVSNALQQPYSLGR